MDLIIKCFAYLEYGSLIQRVKGSVILSVLFSPIAYILRLLDFYVLTDKSFVEILFVFLLIDMTTGVWKHLKLKDFSPKSLFMGMLEKVFISMIAMVLFNAMGHIQGLENNPQALDYFKLTGKLINASYIFGSALTSCYVITGGKFPPLGFMKRVKNFNATGQVDDLVKSSENKQKIESENITSSKN